MLMFPHFLHKRLRSTDPLFGVSDGRKKQARFLCLFRLDEALAQYFGEMTQVAQEDDIYPAMPDPVRKCPQCNCDMILKTRKNGGCVGLLQEPQAPILNSEYFIATVPTQTKKC